TGNAFDNTLSGGEGDDTFIGDGGNDTLNGGSGVNTAQFASNFSAYSFLETANGLIVHGPTGHETLHPISKLVVGVGTIHDDNYADTGTSAQVAVGGAATGGLQFKGDHDWFKVQLVAGHTYAIDERGSPTSGGTLSDAFVRLHDAQGNEIAHDNDL